MSARTSTRGTVVRATAQELLSSFPDGSIDVLVTDPPYTSVERSSGTNGHLQDWFGGGLSWPRIGKVLTLARRKLKPSGLAFVMTNAAGLREAITAWSGPASATCGPSPGTSVPLVGWRPAPPDGVRPPGPAPRIASDQRDRPRVGARGRPGDPRPLPHREARGPGTRHRRYRRHRARRRGGRPLRRLRCAPRGRAGARGDGHRLRHRGPGRAPRYRAPGWLCEVPVCHLPQAAATFT